MMLLLLLLIFLKMFLLVNGRMETDCNIYSILCNIIFDYIFRMLFSVSLSSWENKHIKYMEKL